MIVFLNNYLQGNSYNSDRQLKNDVKIIFLYLFFNRLSTVHFVLNPTVIHLLTKALEWCLLNWQYS